MLLKILVYRNAHRGQIGVQEAYENDTKGRLTAYEKKTTRQKYAKDPKYHKFKQSIYV